jgi:hypothetical protein
MTARASTAAMWDEVLRQWQPGKDAVPSDLTEWRDAYAGRGNGEVVYEAFPEPYVGPMAGDRSPALVMLGLNPGEADLEFQGPGGSFTTQVRATSYSEWAASSPYTSAAWEERKGRNRYVRNRHKFAQRLNQDESIQPQDMLTVELYPWHSARVTSAMSSPEQAMREWVWRPLAETGVENIFAFGAPWLLVAAKLEFRSLGPVKADWEVPSRRCATFQLPSEQRLVVMHHSGSASPPNERDTERLRVGLGL